MKTLLIWHAVVIAYVAAGFGAAAWLLRAWPWVDKDAGPWIVLLWPMIVPFKLMHDAFALLGRLTREVLP